jgi:N-6 DNA Methylase
MTHITTYIQNINTLFKTGNAREHSYRGDLQTLLNKIINDEKIIVTNEPARIIKVGAPDYSITKKGIPLGYIEAKDIGKSLGSADFEEQFKRYREALDNLIITDYLDFWFYKNGTLATKIQIAKIQDGQITPIEANFAEFENLIKSFTTHITQSIKSSSTLAKMMAGKARLLESVLEKAIISDDEANEANNSLKAQMNTFEQILIHDITPSQFADIYAQTIAYGMFAARYHDYTLETFSREEAATLIPKSNPFLRSLFSYISGTECDDRIIWIIDELAEIFKATNIRELLKDFGKSTGQDDPIIHFYETFLGEYNPALKKARGVWYTPQPVVSFIVRAVDEILKSDFGLKDGLADTSKTKIKVEDTASTARNKKGELKQKEIEIHKVQILDPATGTGTFLVETIKQIHKKFTGMAGLWSKYVEDDLIPRLNGFELLMASYAMAHLKFDLLLSESGYKPINPKRFNVFLTNSLEEAHPDTGTLFASWLSNEANQANRVKNESPVMVVLGNPPYAVSSSNKGEWISKLS